MLASKQEDLSSIVRMHVLKKMDSILHAGYTSAREQRQVNS